MQLNYQQNLRPFEEDSSETWPCHSESESPDCSGDRRARLTVRPVTVAVVVLQYIAAATVLMLATIIV